MDEVNDAEETFWLRQASHRARCRLLFLLAEKFGLKIKTISDINSYDGRAMALATTDTVYNNISRLRSGHIAVFNDCVDTTTSRNGIVNSLHPSEGMWIYRGVPRASGGTCPLGFGFGDQRSCGIFPAGTFEVSRPNKNRPLGFSTVFTRSSEAVYTHRSDRSNPGREFSWPDEAFLDTLRSMGWDRNNGIVELIPIVVGTTRG